MIHITCSCHALQCPCLPSYKRLDATRFAIYHRRWPTWEIDL